MEEIKGDDLRVQSVVIKNVKTEEVSELDFGGVFIYVGLDPMTESVADLGITDEAGWVVTNEKWKRAKLVFMPSAIFAKINFVKLQLQLEMEQLLDKKFTTTSQN